MLKTWTRALVKSVALYALACSLVACNGSFQPEDILALGVVNLQRPADNVFVTGQPTEAELGELASLGIKHVINLRPESEQSFDEANVVTSLNMTYHALPIEGAQGVTTHNAQALTDILNSIGDEPVLVHCASGNRVGGLIALQRGTVSGVGVEQSIAEGRRWGLNALEDFVRQKLNTTAPQ
jgi:uncharacterized protein (TIGR01244 family)